MTSTGTSGRNIHLKLMIVLMCLTLLVCLALLGRAAVLMIISGRAVAVALGGALLILPAIGLWAMIATLRAGFAHQKLACLAARDGMELDVSALPRRPSGRIERDAADALFDTVRAELHSDPGDWRRWYRLARAYDYAGDRRRARETMKQALELYRELHRALERANE
jgi:cytochrome c-type biogenesis protein CcmH/NrfG